MLRHGALVDEMVTSEADRGQLSESMVGKTIAEPKAEALESGESIITLNAVTVRSVEASNRLDSVSLTACRSEILGISGVSGNGQSALANLLCGMIKPDSGSVDFWGEKIAHFSPARFVDQKIARIPEDRQKEGVVGEMSLWEMPLAKCIRNSVALALSILATRSVLPLSLLESMISAVTVSTRKPGFCQVVICKN